MKRSKVKKGKKKLKVADEKAVDNMISPEIASAKRAAALAGGNVEAAAEDARNMVISRLFPHLPPTEINQKTLFQNLPDTVLNQIFKYENMSHNRVLSIIGYCNAPAFTKTILHLRNVALKEKELRLLLGSNADELVTASDFAHDEKVIDVATGRPFFPPNRNQRCEVSHKAQITAERLDKIIAAHPEVHYLEANFSRSYSIPEAGKLTPYQVMVRLFKHYRLQLRTLVLRMDIRVLKTIENVTPDFLSIIKSILLPPHSDGKKFLPHLDSLTLEFPDKKISKKFACSFPSNWHILSQLRAIRINAVGIKVLLARCDFNKYASTLDWIGLNQCTSGFPHKYFKKSMKQEAKLKTRTLNVPYEICRNDINDYFPNLLSTSGDDLAQDLDEVFEKTIHLC